MDVRGHYRGVDPRFLAGLVLANWTLGLLMAFQPPLLGRSEEIGHRHSHPVRCAFDETPGLNRPFQ